MGIVNSFEQKIFFNWSRHLWNFLGIGGFIAFSTGVILFLNSLLIESYIKKEDYFRNDFVSKNMLPIKLQEINELIPLKKDNLIFIPLTYEEWLISDNKGVSLLSGKEWLEMNNEGVYNPDLTLDNITFGMYENYKKKQYLLYLNSTENELVLKRNDQYLEYEDYKKQVDLKNKVKLGQRLVSPFVIGYGLAVVASSSLSAALLSIERNTRKKEN